MPDQAPLPSPGLHGRTLLPWTTPEPVPTDGGISLERAQLRRLEVASAAEAVTLLALVGVAVPLKHLAGYADAVHVMGPIHGLVFLAFVWIAVQTVAGGGWSAAEAIRLFVGTLVPFGGFVNLPFLARKGASLR